MAVEDSVAQDQIRAFVERIERLEEEKKAIAEDIKSIYSEARGNGFDVKILRRVVGIRKQDANERMEQEAILELYMSALGMVPAPDEEVYDGERERLNSIAAQLRAAPTKPKADPLAALRADPSMAIVEAANITPKTQPSQPAGSDLTSLAPHEGQVAPIPAAVEGQRSTPVDYVGGSGEAIQPETANEVPSVESANAGGGNVAASENAQDETENTDDLSDAGKPAEASASVAPAPRYAAKGVVTWESTPPEGVERHPYSNAFGTLGQDAVVIADDIAMAKAAPIVKIGNVILDGWARYMTARGSVGLTGQSTEYSVVQYDGEDPLIDCIRWNIAGRMLSDKDKQTVVARLSAIEPKRKGEILKAVAELAA